MEGYVEAPLLGRLIDFDARHEIDQPEHSVREDERPRAAHERGDELLAEKRRIAPQQTIGAVGIPKG
jgi:hypothetical protein